MGKQNQENKKPLKKTSLIQNDQKVKTSKKLSRGLKNEDGEVDDVDSLVFLKEKKDSKKLKGIDEKIKLLKTELKFLFGENKTDKDSDLVTNDSDLVSCNVSNLGVKKLEHTASTKEKWDFEELNVTDTKDFKPNYNSTPSKFLEELDKTTDEINLNSQDKICLTDESQLNSKLNSSSEASQPNSFPACPKTISSNKFSLPQEKVEQLLYMSFLMQNNSDLYPSISEISPEQNRFANKSKQKSRKNKKQQLKCKRGRSVQSSSGSKTSQRFFPRRKRRMVSESDVEIIDLVDSSVSNKTPKKDIECVDLDVSSYDWNETFEINDDTELHSDTEVIQGSEKKKVFNENNKTPYEFNKSISLDVSGTKKQVWECPVCFEQSKGQEIVATQCGHIFCKKCLENHISKLTNSCPSCRCNLKKKPFITLFNF